MDVTQTVSSAPVSAASAEPVFVRRHMADRARAPEVEGGTLADLVDIINPLQHIPFVSTLYQELTGDTVSPAAKVAGGALFGGPIGLFASVADAVVEAATGSSVEETMVAMFSGSHKEADVQVAMNTQADTAKASARYAAGEVSDAQVEEALVGSASPVSEAATQSVQDATLKLAAMRYQQQAEQLQGTKTDVLAPEPAASAKLAVADAQMAAAQMDGAVLDLFGGSKAPTAHRSYRQANMLGYLQSFPQTQAVM